jgi:uncharacterized membrane protein
MRRGPTKRRTRGRPTAILSALLVAACGDAGDPAPADLSPDQGARAGPVSFEAPAGLPGELLLVEGLLRFRPCGQGDAQPMDDGTGSEAARAVRELGYGEDRVLAVVVLDGVRLLEVRHATPEAPGCEALLRDGDLHAWGNEPFWNASIEGDRLLWRTPEDPEGIPWTEGRWERPAGDQWRFEARRDGVDGVDYLTLELAEERCRDTMAGSYYPFSARVRIEGRVLEGCALEGTGAVPDP